MSPSEFVAQIQTSHPNAIHYYTKGGCWEFFALARRVFPTAYPLYATNPRHVAVQLGPIVFDVTGLVDPRNPEGSPYEWFPGQWWKQAQPWRWRARVRLSE